jgi:hypothetical protein
VGEATGWWVTCPGSRSGPWRFRVPGLPEASPSALLGVGRLVEERRLTSAYAPACWPRSSG